MPSNFYEPTNFWCYLADRVCSQAAYLYKLISMFSAQSLDRCLVLLTLSNRLAFAALACPFVYVCTKLRIRNMRADSIWSKHFVLETS